MEPQAPCGCHEDYHELGVHRPGHGSSTATPAGTDDDLAVSGAA